MPETECSKYEHCTAPLCPLAEGLEHHCWYPSEPICSSRRFTALPWVRRQRRIAALQIDDGAFFTVAMLKSLHRVGKRTTGADPDAPNSEAAWLRRREG